MDTKERIGILDLMRFVAAMMVLLFHYFYSGIYNGKIQGVEYSLLVDYIKYGYLGVEFFFMISGYVIFRSALSHDFKDFVIGRFRRLFPAFWTCVLLTSILVNEFGHSDLNVSTLQVIANLTMFPKIFDQKFVDGVYWTLTYEIIFYSFISILLFIRFKKYLRTIFIIWAFLILMHGEYGNYLSSIFLLKGYYCYFVTGALFSIIQQRTSLISVIALVLTCKAALLFSLQHSLTAFSCRQHSFSQLIIGSTILLMFLFFGSLARGWLPNINGKITKILGGMSYPLYLLHAHIGFSIITKLTFYLDTKYSYLLSLFIVLILSFFVYQFVELYFKKMWNMFFMNTVGRCIDVVYLLFTVINNTLYRLMPCLSRIVRCRSRSLDFFK
jgi:peptidoglycan/LPS O-acetylase OafA/YrhL